MIFSILTKRTCAPMFAIFASTLMGGPICAQVTPPDNAEIKVVARISKQFVNDIASREEVVAAVPYQATALGFYSQGLIDGRGKLSVELTTVQGSTNFVVHSHGAGATYVRSVRGPFVAMGPGWGPFKAQTVVRFDGRKFVILSTSTCVQVNLQLDRIEGIRGRPVGRVVGRLLRPLAQPLIPRAEAQATPMIAYYVNKFIDEFGKSIVSKLNEINPIEKSIDRLFPEARNWVFQVSGDPEFIQTAFGPPHSKVPELPKNPARLKNVRMELWLHSTATEAQDLAKISKLPLAKALTDKYLETQLPELAALSNNRSVDAVGPWLVISIGEPRSTISSVAIP